MALHQRPLRQVQAFEIQVEQDGAGEQQRVGESRIQHEQARADRGTGQRDERHPPEPFQHIAEPGAAEDADDHRGNARDQYHHHRELHIGSGSDQWRRDHRETQAESALDPAGHGDHDRDVHNHPW